MGMTDGQWRGYLREALEHQKEIEEALEKDDLNKAKELVKKMIQRTQQNIEDA